MNAFMREFTTAAKKGPQLYFEPVVGIIKFVRTCIGLWKNRHHLPAQ